MSEEADEAEDDGGGILCWMCPVCATLGLLASVFEGRCMQKPPRADCPIPIPSAKAPD